MATISDVLYKHNFSRAGTAPVPAVYDPAFVTPVYYHQWTNKTGSCMVLVHGVRCRVLTRGKTRICYGAERLAEVLVEALQGCAH